jgi:hypothetical protein
MEEVMSESHKRMRANRSLEGKPCLRCQQPVSFGDEVAVCGACKALHHAGCWDGNLGCCTEECANAPLKELATGTKEAPPEGRVYCPHCGKQISSKSTFCVYCKQAPTADGRYRGTKTNAPGSVASLVYGIIGLFFCGIIFGLLAISKSNSAREAMRADPRLGGEGLASAGRILGIIALIGWALLLLARLAANMG